VACETFTRPAGDPAAFDAESFAAEWPEEERGLVGEERAIGFAWLAREIGFSCELVNSFCSRPWAPTEHDDSRRSTGSGAFSSKVNGGVAHRSVIANLGGRRVLADAGFPFPCLVPLDPPFQEIPSSLGTLSVAATDEIRVLCDARGEIETLISLPLEEIRRPFPGTPPPHATRILDDRVLHWSGGRMTILDAWSVLTYPLAGRERAALASLFALNLDGVDPPDAPPADEPAVLSVFHALPVPPDEARRGLALADPPGSVVASRAVTVVPAPGGSRLVSRAVLSGAVPPAGPGESVRRTLVFHLAMELLGARGSGEP